MCLPDILRAVQAWPPEAAAHKGEASRPRLLHITLHVPVQSLISLAAPLQRALQTQRRNSPPQGVATAWTLPEAVGQEHGGRAHPGPRVWLTGGILQFHSSRPRCQGKGAATGDAWRSCVLPEVGPWAGSSWALLLKPCGRTAPGPCRGQESPPACQAQNARLLPPLPLPPDNSHRTCSRASGERASRAQAGASGGRTPGRAFLSQRATAEATGGSEGCHPKGGAFNSPCSLLQPFLLLRPPCPLRFHPRPGPFCPTPRAPLRPAFFPASPPAPSSGAETRKARTSQHSISLSTPLPTHTRSSPPPPPAQRTNTGRPTSRWAKPGAPSP